MDISTLSELLRQKAFLEGGGGQESDLDKINKTFGTIRQTGLDLSTIRSQAVETALKKKEIQLKDAEMKGKLGEQTQYGKVIGVPTTSDVQSTLKTAQEAPIPLADLQSGKLDTMQAGIDKATGQAKAATAFQKTSGIDTDTAIAQAKTAADIGYKAAQTTKLATPDASKTLNPAALEMYAQQTYEKGGELPANLGFAGGIRIQIMNRAAQIAEEKGDNAQAQILRGMSFKSGQAELTKIQTQRGLIEAFTKTAGANLDLYERTIDGLANSGVTWLNRPIIWLQKNVSSDPRIAEYLTAHQVASQEATRVLQGNMAGVLSDSARAEVSNILDKNYTPNQTRAAIKTLKSDIANREESYKRQIDETKSGLFDTFHGTSTPEATPSPDNSEGLPIPAPEGYVPPPPPPPAEKLSGELPPAAHARIVNAGGKEVTFQNGQTWKFENGKSIRVK